jgi:hypothetical protein
MGHLTFEYDRDDLNLFMRMGGETTARLNHIIVEDPQGAELDVIRIIVRRK